jgi:hypothetical protein
MNSLFTKLRDFVGLNETGYDYDYPEGVSEDYQSFYPEEAGAPGKKSNAVVVVSASGLDYPPILMLIMKE